MKTILKSIIILIAILQSTLASAQFNVGPGLLYGRTDASMQKIGIGNFAVNADVQGKLHVNHFLLNTNTATDGFLFRTDGDQGTDNRWQMFTGSDASSQTERFRIRTLAGGYDTYLERTHIGSEADVRLLTAEVQIRARGKRLGDFCELAGALADEVTIGDGTDVNFTTLSETDRRLFFHGADGFLGLGSDFSESALNPNYNFHIHDNLEGSTVYQQFTNANSGNGVSDGLRLGLNANTSYELRAFEPNIWLDIAQNNEVRMRFRDIDNYTGLNGISYGEVSRIMIPLRNQDANLQPMSLMQLGTSNDGALEREWMNVGTTYGANADAMYVGWMERANEGGGNLQSDAVIAWGCQRGSNNNSLNSDNFRIIFLAPNFDTNADSSGTTQGKEVFRIEPFDGNVGIGNFSVTGDHPPGTDDYIGAQLDIDGDLRIRQLELNDSLNMVLVADSSDLNRVYWRPASSIASEACEWNVVDNGGSADLVMGYTGACNDGNVGIGTGTPIARLHINNFLETTGNTALIRNTSTGNIGQIGLMSRTVGGKTHNVAVNGFASANEFGSVGNNTPVIGVRGVGNFNGQCYIDAIGVYGEAISSPTCGAGYAGYFAGNVVTFGAVIPISDMNVKTNIQPLENNLSKILQLQPRAYQMSAEAGDFIDTERLNFGLIAQEVEEIFPNLVAEVRAPILEDEEGNIVNSPERYKGVIYNELIPLLIGAVQEQQVMIEEQQSQISALTDLVNSCCAADAGENRNGDLQDDIRIVPQQGENRLDQNAPNPFEDHTLLKFSLAKTSQARVCIYNSNGQLIDCLIDGNTAAGEHSLIWNTAQLAPGIYFYSLEVDGFEQVRRAVKL